LILFNSKQNSIIMLVIIIYTYAVEVIDKVENVSDWRSDYKTVCLLMYFVYEFKNVRINKT